MSAEEPVIAVSSETSEPGRVDPSAVPLPENLEAKDTSSISDFLSKEPVTEPPADTAQTAPDDTQPVLLKHDTDIPNPTPTNANGSTDGVEAMTLVSVELLNSFLFLLPFRVARGTTVISFLFDTGLYVI